MEFHFCDSRASRSYLTEPVKNTFTKCCLRKQQRNTRWNWQGSRGFIEPRRVTSKNNRQSPLVPGNCLVEGGWWLMVQVVTRGDHFTLFAWQFPCRDPAGLSAQTNARKQQPYPPAFTAGWLTHLESKSGRQPSRTWRRAERPAPRRSSRTATSPSRSQWVSSVKLSPRRIHVSPRTLALPTGNFHFSTPKFQLKFTDNSRVSWDSKVQHRISMQSACSLRKQSFRFRRQPIILENNSVRLFFAGISSEHLHTTVFHWAERMMNERGQSLLLWTMLCSTSRGCHASLNANEHTGNGKIRVQFVHCVRVPFLSLSSDPWEWGQSLERSQGSQFAHMQLLFLLASLRSVRKSDFFSRLVSQRNNCMTVYVTT